MMAGVGITSDFYGAVALFDMDTRIAFGPVFRTQQQAEGFLEHLATIGERDPRHIPALELAVLAREWRVEKGES